MNRRFKAIINYVHRFRVNVSSWAAIRGFFFHARIGIKVNAFLRKKIKLFINAILAVGFIGELKRKGNIWSDIKIGLDMFANLSGKYRLKYTNGFRVGVDLLLRKLGNLKFKSFIGIGFSSLIMRKRPVNFDSGVKVGLSATTKKKGRLHFDNKKLTVYTVTMLKNFTVGMLKQRNIGTMKREVRIIPQFRIDLTCNLKKNSGGVIS
jgi:hypothetical protein